MTVTADSASSGAPPALHGSSQQRRSLLGSVAAVMLIGLALPFVVSDFNIGRVGAEALFVAIIALSFTFLSATSGMVSLAQTALATIAGYSVAYSTASHKWPVALGVIAAIGLSMTAGLIFGLVATRTSGIYFLMITLAMGLVVNKFALQNRGITNGFTGINSVHGPRLGGINLDNGIHRYYVELVVVALVYAALRLLNNSHFGSTLHAVRDNPTRMRSLGFAVDRHRIAAFTVAAAIAGIGGIFSAWNRGRVDPTAASLGQAIDLLIACVLGGLSQLEGALVGAVVFVVLRTYASDVTTRFNTFIGVALLAVALANPDGLSGLARRVGRHLRARR
jgi:branched-chain amino acid transport system permease protein